MNLPLAGQGDWRERQQGPLVRIAVRWESRSRRPETTSGRTARRATTPTGRAPSALAHPTYSVRIAGWHVLSLNSEEPHEAGSPQVHWLERQVADGGDCRIAFWHRPRYSAGTHGDQPDVDPLWHALEGRAALVVNGHDHDLQELRVHEGIRKLVAGAGGTSATRSTTATLVGVGHRPDRRGAAVAAPARPGALRLRRRRRNAPPPRRRQV
jgi:hypothetical protein